MKITSFEVEGVKRIKAVALEPTPKGLTVIGGRNRQGKTSVLDAILWTLGGNKYRPSDPECSEAVGTPRTRITLDNGIVVERKGKNSTLTVTDPQGRRAGQELLDGLISQIALNLPAFMNATPKQKAETLLKVIGVGDQLQRFEEEEKRLYDERRSIGMDATRKKKHAEDLPFEEDAPAQEVSASELIQRQQAILARNGENQRKREQAERLEQAARRQTEEVARLRAQLDEAVNELQRLNDDLATARKSADDLRDESTAEIEADLQRIDEINRKVRINAQKAQAQREASSLQSEYDALTEQIEEVRENRLSLLSGAKLPLDGLSIEGGELTYNGRKWDGMATSEQLRVAVAIGRAIRPSCEFVLLDKTEHMDIDTLKEFGAWVESEGLQVIATRVSTGDECSIIIEDGVIVGGNQDPAASQTATTSQQSGGVDF